MKVSQGFAFATAALAALRLPLVHAAPINTCGMQDDCVKFTTTQKFHDKCGSTSPCEFEICMTIDESGSCQKDGSISHTCVKDNTVCYNSATDSSGFKFATETASIGNGYTQCQTVGPNQTVQFLLKDGSGCKGSGSTLQLSGGQTASCAPRPSTTQSCTGNAVGVECIWTVTSPSCTELRAIMIPPTAKPTTKPTKAPTNKPTTSPTQAPVEPGVQVFPPPPVFPATPGPTLSPTKVPTAAPVNHGSCSKQNDCVMFTATKANTTLCTGTTCEYIVCMTVSNLGSCYGPNRFTDTCIKDDSVCSVVDGFAGATPDTDGMSPSSYTQCQTVGNNEVAEFLLKDGDTCDGELSKDYEGHFVSCAASTLAMNSCTGNLPGTECVWRVQAPSSCGNSGSGGGDPHFKLWNRTRFPFHGECDLVLLDNEDFDHGTGLHIHVRTTSQKFWSFIETAAIRVGSDIVEISREGFFINGVEGSFDQLPTTLADFTLRAYGHNDKTMTYRIELNDGDFIKISLYKEYLNVDVFGLDKDFENSVGLLGHYHTGTMFARDKKTIIDDPIEFGMEWQVTDNEPMLFRDVREPIYPAKCNMPDTSRTGRHLRSEASPAFVLEAEAACAHKNEHDYEFCVFDVLATGDLGMARAW